MAKTHYWNIDHPNCWQIVGQVSKLQSVPVCQICLMYGRNALGSQKCTYQGTERFKFRIIIQDLSHFYSQPSQLRVQTLSVKEKNLQRQ